MEENNTSTLAENYWLTTAKVIKPGFFHDYFTNPKKRFTTGFASNVGEHFWQKYAEAYNKINTVINYYFSMVFINIWIII